MLGLFRKTLTVEGITASLTDTVKLLDAHAETQRAEMLRKVDEAERLLAQRQKHEEELIKAQKVAAQIGALLS